MSQYEDYIKLDCMRRFKRAKELYNETKVIKVNECNYIIQLPGHKHYPITIKRDGEYQCGCVDSKYQRRLCKHIIIFVKKYLDGEIEDGESK